MVLTKKPTAPRGALIPALQQRILLEECISSSRSLVQPNQEVNDKNQILEKLKTIVAPLPDGTSTLFRQQPIKLGLEAEPFANQQYLQGNVVRVAMNLYTSNLRLENDLPSYTVTDPAWKKSYIRQNDGLPDIAKVLQADMDLRDLYRNSIVTYLDDASAELYSNDVDFVELNQLLVQAAEQFDLWLGRIDDAEVKVELQSVLEGKTPKIYKSYYAGFVPPK
ncbi:unnamed protein product [Cylindrotheca closterium]|uniref:Uncharacterized protein n=1 Tax=Cylindrotheca closterium TaxID=2856 RepID=A0AAD2G5S9_9STRA|nr:unnamed protein product [Cylindrotheca closterium]